MRHDTMWYADSVGPRLQPTCFLDRIGTADRSLHVHHPVDVLKTCLGEEVLRPVVLSLDRAVISYRLGRRRAVSQPVPPQPRV